MAYGHQHRRQTALAGGRTGLSGRIRCLGEEADTSDGNLPTEEVGLRHDGARGATFVDGVGRRN